MIQLTPNVYIETGYFGANVSCVSTDDGLVLIDTPARPTDAVAWRKAVESKGKLKYLINLESHDDHYAGSFFFDVPAVAHEISRKAMLAADINHIKGMLRAMDPAGLYLIKDYKVNVPVITFSEYLTLHLGKHSFHLIFLPGHSAGQIAVFVPEEKVVFTGDNVTYKRRGFLHEADPFAWLESLKRIGELDADYIVPGHGDVCDKSYLKEEAKYVQDCMDVVKKAIDQGWTKDEAVDKVALPDYFPLDEGSDEVATMLFRMSIANLYDRLSGR